MSALLDALKRVKRLPVARHARRSQPGVARLSTSGVVQSSEARRLVYGPGHREGKQGALPLEPATCPPAVVATL